MFKIAEYAEKVAELRSKVISAFNSVGLEFSVKENQDSGTIKLVFAGQYSAGKSSILKMLTGRNDIAIGAGITTQKAHTYKWNGMEVVDTPGIHTELRPDHDEISYSAISSADMLVFVVTNELFDSYLADHFRKLAIDRDKAGEMILVVNKMERASEGNTLAQQNVIREDLRKVLAPYTPEQLNLCFLDAESFLDSIEERTEDPELADELYERSGYVDFVETLNHFVDEKSIPSKLTTGLYLLEDELEKAVLELEPKSSDTDINALEEIYMQQRHALLSSRNQLQQEAKDVFTLAAAAIREIGLDSANLLVEGCKQDDVEEEIEKAIRKADDITEKCQKDVIQLIETRLTEMGQDLDLIEDAELTQQLKIRLTGKFASLPGNVQKLLGGAGPGLQKAGQAVVGKAYKPGVQGGMKLSNFSGSSVHEIVLKAGHAIKFKFKPWQAVKVAKGVAVGGKVFGVIGVALSIFMQIKSDHDADKLSEELKKTDKTSVAILMLLQMNWRIMAERLYRIML
ncbi:MAG: GTPase [Acutalibacteraceae bacterium]|jgi:small GTP-binding protein